MTVSDMGDRGFQKMIWGKRDGQLDIQIVLRKGGSAAGVARRVAAKSEDSEGAADLGLSESG